MLVDPQGPCPDVTTECVHTGDVYIGFYSKIPRPESQEALTLTVNEARMGGMGAHLCSSNSKKNPGKGPVCLEIFRDLPNLRHDLVNLGSRRSPRVPINELGVVGGPHCGAHRQAPIVKNMGKIPSSSEKVEEFVAI